MTTPKKETKEKRDWKKEVLALLNDTHVDRILKEQNSEQEE